jgi:hypothetical protein
MRPRAYLRTLFTLLLVRANPALASKRLRGNSKTRRTTLFLLSLITTFTWRIGEGLIWRALSVGYAANVRGDSEGYHGHVAMDQ